jgi:DNA-binding response OmpR family regulator
MRILLADDEPSIRFIVALHLQRRGWTVDEVANGTEALDSATTRAYDALVLDQRMPGLTGVEVARELSTPVPVFIFSAFVDDHLDTQARMLGCSTVDKDDIEELLASLEALATR